MLELCVCSLKIGIKECLYDSRPYTSILNDPSFVKITLIQI